MNRIRRKQIFRQMLCLLHSCRHFLVGQIRNCRTWCGFASNWRRKIFLSMQEKSKNAALKLFENEQVLLKNNLFPLKKKNACTSKLFELFAGKSAKNGIARHSNCQPISQEFYYQYCTKLIINFLGFLGEKRKISLFCYAFAQKNNENFWDGKERSVGNCDCRDRREVRRLQKESTLSKFGTLTKCFL